MFQENGKKGMNALLGTPTAIAQMAPEAGQGWGDSIAPLGGK